MGTQFWWFYDVLIIAVAAGLLYNAAAKGLNKMIFPLVGCILAFAAGCFGSGLLAEPAYNMLFQENISETIQTEYEEMDFVPAVLEQFNRMNPEDTVDQRELKELLSAESIPETVSDAAGEVVQAMLTRRFAPLPEESVSDLFRQEPEQLRHFLDAEEPADAAAVLEEQYFRPFYLEMVQLAGFLLIAVVILIVVGIISNMAGNLEELMHIRRFSHVLAFPIGIVRAAFALIAITAAVRLIVLSTENMMMLFNEETIAETKIFHYLYDRL